MQVIQSMTEQTPIPQTSLAVAWTVRYQEYIAHVLNFVFDWGCKADYVICQCLFWNLEAEDIIYIVEVTPYERLVGWERGERRWWPPSGSAHLSFLPDILSEICEENLSQTGPSILWLYVWGWWDGKRGKWEEWEEEGGTSEAAVPAQPEREGRGSSVGRREIPSAGADCDLSICETKSPLPSACAALLLSSESFRPRHLVWWNLSFFKSQPEETSFKEMLLSYS